MWAKVLFFDAAVFAWVADPDLWATFAAGPAPTADHVLALVADDAPWRWLLPAPA